VKQDRREGDSAGSGMSDSLNKWGNGREYSTSSGGAKDSRKGKREPQHSSKRN